VLTTVAITGAAPASAHTVLTATDPAGDSTLSAGPHRVSATFNEDLQTTFAAMTVVGPDGNLWSSGDTEVRGPVASVGVRPLGPSGEYTVNYRVTSDDGHVVSGSWSFTVTVPSTGAPGPSVSGTAESQRISLWPFIIGAGFLVAGVAAWTVRRRS
jgi:methionine-rich copper-binding protein CopC